MENARLERFLDQINCDPRIKRLVLPYSLRQVRKEKTTAVLIFSLPSPLPFPDFKAIYYYFSQKKITSVEGIDSVKLQFEPAVKQVNLNQLRDYLSYFAEQVGHHRFQLIMTEGIKTMRPDGTLEIEITANAEAFFAEQIAALKRCLEEVGINNSLCILATLETPSAPPPDLSELGLERDDEENEEAAIEETPPALGFGKIEETTPPQRLHGASLNLAEVTPETDAATLVGAIFKIDVRNTRRGAIFQIGISDGESALYVDAFSGRRLSLEFLSELKVNDWIRVQGKMTFNDYRKRHVFSANNIEVIDVETTPFSDEAADKRVELHVHTKLSAMDGINDIDEYMRAAKQMGHEAIALTDHGVVQAFPLAQAAAQKLGIKVIYGMEGYIVDPVPAPVVNPSDQDLKDATYVFLDLETTGLSPDADAIIEIGAVKVHRNVEQDIIKSFTRYTEAIPDVIKRLTGITEADVVDAPSLKQVLKDLVACIGDNVIVAHNATFDMQFINTKLIECGMAPLKNPVIDTLSLSKYLLPNLTYYRLGSVSKELQVIYNEEKAHRAFEDAIVLSRVFEHLLELALGTGATTLNDLNQLKLDDPYRRAFPGHVSILIKSQVGVKHLYQLVSLSHIKYFSQVPRIPRAELEARREGLLLGTSCLNGEIFDLAQTASLDRFKAALKWYDYVEIQPLEHYQVAVDLERIRPDRLVPVLMRIVNCARELGIPVVATGDVHHLRPSDLLQRKIFVNTLATGQTRHPLNDYKERIKEIPNCYFRSTAEMMAAMDYLPEALRHEIVVTNSQLIARMCGEVTPIAEAKSPVDVEGSDVRLREIVYRNAHKRYGDPLPEVITTRLEKELHGIISSGYAVIYYSAHYLVNKAREDGRLVGSRGSVGSSLVATFADITEVNPMPPHYICPNCHFFELMDVASGYDLPPRACPNCATPLIRDGQDIPFATFLGFEGEKMPDIDLNFDAEYQNIAHLATRDIFGADKVFRAGTISTVKEKKAFGYVRAYFEKINDKVTLENPALIDYYVSKCMGVKATTSQHPGGIIAIPNEREVEDFTPIQYPADRENDWVTTHIDYNALHNSVLKLDLLGHVDPKALLMLHQLTGIDPRTVELNDPQVMALFTSLEPLGISRGEVPNWELGIAGLPDMSTPLIRRMVSDIKPTKFSHIVKISGLSHGKQVWQGNLDDVFRSGIPFDDIIGCRDDIMTYLIKKGIEPRLAFQIMEIVRKGDATKKLTPAMIKLMQEADLASWYLDACMKINYLFPKAHATAYVMMACRIGWYKIYRPLEYYASYFTCRINYYDLETLCAGVDEIRAAHRRITDKGWSATDKENQLINTYEIALEMLARGFHFKMVDINRSQAVKFTIDYENNALIFPFCALDGLGESSAEKMVAGQPYQSNKDFLERSGIKKTMQQLFTKLGILESEADKQKLTLFNF